MKSLEERLEKEANLRLAVQYGRFPPGPTLWEEIKAAILDCDIAVFDISENAPNVLLEAGLAFGQEKCVFLLKNNESTGPFSVPSDLPVVRIHYDPSSVEAKIASGLFDGIGEYLLRKHPQSYFSKRLWGFRESDAVTVICSQLEDADERQHPEPKEFLDIAKYGDADALTEVLITLHRLFPGSDVSFQAAGDVTPHEAYDENSIVTSGPV